MAYNNSHITCLGFHPLYTPEQPPGRLPDRIASRHCVGAGSDGQTFAMTFGRWNQCRLSLGGDSFFCPRDFELQIIIKYIILEAIYLVR